MKQKIGQDIKHLVHVTTTFIQMYEFIISFR